MRYTLPVIKSFLHKGLGRFYVTGSKSGIQPQRARRLRIQLTALDTATSIEVSFPNNRITLYHAASLS